MNLPKRDLIDGRFGFVLFFFSSAASYNNSKRFLDYKSSQLCKVKFTYP